MRPVIKFLLVLLVVILIVSVIFRITQQIQESDTNPKRIPSYDEVVPKGFSALGTKRVVDYRDTGVLMKPDLKLAKITDNILEVACPIRRQQCAARALYEWTQQSLTYSEVLPTREHIIGPAETILYREGNQMTLSILLISLLRSENVEARLAYTPSLIFVEAKVVGETLWLDPGCATCPYGRARYKGPEETIVWVE